MPSGEIAVRTIDILGGKQPRFTLPLDDSSKREAKAVYQAILDQVKAVRQIHKDHKQMTCYVRGNGLNCAVKAAKLTERVARETIVKHRQGRQEPKRPHTVKTAPPRRQPAMRQPFRLAR